MTNNLNADFALKYINSAMNLRKPQFKSLELFANYLKTEVGQKVLLRLKNKAENEGLKNGQKLVDEILAESINYFSQISETKDFAEFERKFPAFTFALATGVGKTRLMGAFVAYLYLVYGVQHFLIVAPNLTIYRKLLTDFSKSNHPKYVFRGIQEINTTTARIITTNNYANEAGKQLFANQLEINIFNIQQFAQKQKDATQERGINKMWETAGDSYFDYLKSQSDLVVMLDEAHHYHADAALESLDVLDPLFALEMTATPYLGTKGSGKNARQIVMKNVLYSYNLGDAIRGKLVKNPWIGTEADLDFSKFDFDSIEGDNRKLQLAAFFHQRAKLALQEYALENNLRVIKPVLLVVAKDTNHAKELRILIDSDNFRGGEFKGKVLEIHTKVKGEEAEENIEQLISLEDEGNLMEVVIHVNMLKEGWDIANVYTIAPLRQSAAAILTEQTIGRGLRLPYGERTGNELVDKLVIVAHEQYAKILEMAKDSVLIQGQNFEEISLQEIGEKKVLIQSLPVAMSDLVNEIEKSAATITAIEIEAKKEVLKNPQNANLSEERQQEIIATKTRNKVLDLAKKIISNEQQSVKNLLLFDYDGEAKSELNKIATDFYEKPKPSYIAIPRLDLRPNFAEMVIRDFDLDGTRMRFYQNYRNIIEEQLQNDLEKNLPNKEIFAQKRKEETRINSFGNSANQSPQNAIIEALRNFDVVDYDDKNQKPLLLKLANQAVNHYRKKAEDEENLALIVESNIHTIAEDIHKQISEKVEFKSPSYLELEIGKPKPLEQHNITTVAENCVSLQSQLDSFNAKFIYENFKKACHERYRFDSSDEVRFAYLLENEDAVKCWLRPTHKQFEGLFYKKEPENILSNYEPDFVVELANEIILVEVKPENEMHDLNVLAKKQVAEKYCELTSQNIGKFEIVKPWRYAIVATNRIKITATIDTLLGYNS